MDNGIKIWLDDIRPAPDGWVWVATYNRAVNLLKVYQNNISDMSFDHDLGDYSVEKGREVTGYDVVCYMEENGIWPVNKPTVHSSNPSGRQRIQAVLDKIYNKE